MKSLLRKTKIDLVHLSIGLVGSMLSIPYFLINASDLAFLVIALFSSSYVIPELLLGENPNA